MVASRAAHGSGSTLRATAGRSSKLRIARARAKAVHLCGKERNIDFS